jgi:hypothetical protein
MFTQPQPQPQPVPHPTREEWRQILGWKLRTK